MPGSSPATTKKAIEQDDAAASLSAGVYKHFTIQIVVVFCSYQSARSGPPL